MPRMTMRDRMLAVVQGKPHDRVPFVTYQGMAPLSEAWDLVGRGNLGVLRWVSVYRNETPHCRFDQEPIVQDGHKGVRTTLRTPEGDLAQEKFFTPAFGDSGPAATHKQFVTEPGDYKVVQTYFRDTRVHAEPEALPQVLRELGDDGSVQVTVNRTPWQALWVEWVRMEDLAWHLAEAPAVVEETMALMGEVLLAQCRMAAASPAPYVCFPDNITAPMVGVERFRKYGAPYYRAMAGMLDGRPVYVHMDGDLKVLWQAIGESGVGGIDSMSPPPDNDTSVADALRLWPQMRVAVNFPSSVHLRPAADVYAAAREILDQGGSSGRLQIQISEDMPPGAWLKSFPEIVRAIADFGKAA